MVWQRQRNPDDVPTPVAVAVSDFCRRAKAAASPSEVRDALSHLGDADDFRVRRITDAEPTATPLGPYAVVDMVRGTDAAMASTRQQCGYYELLRDLVSQVAQPPPPAPTPPSPSSSSRNEAVRPAVKAAKQTERHPPTLAEKIAPKKRAPDRRPPPETTSQPDGPPLVEGGTPPRGRFARLRAPKRSLRELFSPESKPLIAQHLQQYGNRIAALEALGQLFEGRASGPLALKELDEALERHGLAQSASANERERLLTALGEHRGALGRVAWSLGLSPAGLTQLIHGLGMERQVQQLRERFARQTLAERGLAQRLELAGRTRYLKDLGIQHQFIQALKRDLNDVLKAEAGRVRSVDELIRVAAKNQGLRADLLERSIDRLGLRDIFRSQLEVETSSAT